MPLDAGDPIVAPADHFARRFNHYQALCTGPILIWLLKPSNIICDQVAPSFAPAMVFFSLDIAPERPIHRVCIGIEPQHNCFSQAGCFSFTPST